MTMGNLGDMKATLGDQGGAEQMGEDSRQRGTYLLLGTPASAGVNPRLSVVLGAVWVRGYCLLPCIYLHSATRAQGTL